MVVAFGGFGGDAGPGPGPVVPESDPHPDESTAIRNSEATASMFWGDVMSKNCRGCACTLAEILNNRDLAELLWVFESRALIHVLMLGLRLVESRRWSSDDNLKHVIPRHARAKVQSGRLQNTVVPFRG